VRLLLVDDSNVIRTYVEAAVRTAPDIEWLPPAVDGAAAVRSAIELSPDVILMDINMPVFDGIVAITEIMAEAPCPIVVLSGHLHRTGRDRSFEALNAGAVEVLTKPKGLDPVRFQAFREKLLRTLRLMSTACVVRRRRRSGHHSAPKSAQKPVPRPGLLDLLAIGSSTGGPAVLAKIIARLPKPYPLPVVISQHIIPGFERSLCEWLSTTSGHPVRVAEDGEELSPGNFLVSPADGHLVVRDGRCAILPPEADSPVPSVDLLFTSLSAQYGDRALGVLLTGMGRDGAKGLLAMVQQGAQSITQAKESCIVDGMPAAARELGASLLELAPEAIAQRLSELRRRR